MAFCPLSHPFFTLIAHCGSNTNLIEMKVATGGFGAMRFVCKELFSCLDYGFWGEKRK